MISVPWQWGQCRTCIIMISLGWLGGCSASHTPRENNRPTPLKHPPKWIWDSATRLTETIVKWHYTEGDTRYDGIAALFSAQISRSARQTGVLRFQFPGLLIPILKDPRRFARLRTHFMIELSGKYAVTLYELLESVANKDVPEL